MVLKSSDIGHKTASKLISENNEIAKYE